MPFTPGNETSGNLSAVGLARETTFNTPVTPSQFDPFNSLALGADPGLFFPQVMQGIREADVFALYGQEKMAGGLDSPLFPHNGILAWIAAVGHDGSQSGSSTTAVNGTIGAASAGATTITWTAVTGVPVSGSYIQVGIAANGVFGVSALGTGIAPSQVIKVTAVTGSGPYTLTVPALAYAIVASGAGQNNTAQAVIAPFFHAVIPGVRPCSLTIEKNMGGLQSEQFSGCMVNTFALKLPTSNAEASFSADLMAASVAVLDTPSAITGIDDGLPFVFAEGALSLFGQSLNTVSNVTVTLGNTVKDTYTVGSSHMPTYLTPTTRTVSGQLTVIFYSLDDSTYGYFKKALPSLATSGVPTQGALSLTLAHPDLTAFNIVLPQINIEKIADEVKIGDMIMQTLDFKASYNIASSGILTSYFSNNVAYAPY